MTIDPKNMQLASSKVNFLGVDVDCGQVFLSQEKIPTIAEYRYLTTRKA